jgi:hypothetical protein
MFKVGDKVTAKITKIEPDSGKVSVSRKQVLKEHEHKEKNQERKTLQSYMRRNDTGGLNSMGELLGNLRLKDDRLVGQPKSSRPERADAPSQLAREIKPESLEDDLPPTSQEAPGVPEAPGEPDAPIQS